MDRLQDRLKNLVQSTLENEGFELVDLVVRGNSSSRVLQFFVDHERGITLDDCVHLNRKLSNLLESEAEQIELGSYSLEVSSPGLDRPLKTEKDFQRNIGRTVSLLFFKNSTKKHLEGVILNTNGYSVYLHAEKQTICVPFSSIQHAKIKLKL